MITQETFIIVGSSAASMGALSKLRALKPTATIMCITAETDMPYNRCLLADHLSGSKTKDAIITKKTDFFAENNIQLMLGVSVTSVNPEQNYITIQNGQKISSQRTTGVAGHHFLREHVPDQ